MVIIGGRSGTLGEFAIAYEEGKLIGVLTGTGGITEALRSIEATLHKETGAEVIYESDPAQLIDRLLHLSVLADQCRPRKEIGRHGDAPMSRRDRYGYGLGKPERASSSRTASPRGLRPLPGAQGTTAPQLASIAGQAHVSGPGPGCAHARERD